MVQVRLRQRVRQGPWKRLEAVDEHHAAAFCRSLTPRLELEEQVLQHESHVEPCVHADRLVGIPFRVGAIVGDARPRHECESARCRLGLERRLQRGQQRERVVAEDERFDEVPPCRGEQVGEVTDLSSSSASPRSTH